MAKTPSRPKRIRRSTGEMSFCAALEAGEKWTPEFHDAWCKTNKKDRNAPITVRGELIRAILFVEGAHMSGCTPPQTEAERLDSYSLDPTRRHLAQALVIDWVTDNLATVDRTRVEKDMKAKGEFEALPDFWTKEQKDKERERRITADCAWRAHHLIANRPVITGDLNFTGGQFPGALVLRGCVFGGSGARKPAVADDTSPDGNLTLDRAVLGGLDLTGAALGQLSGDRLRVEADFQAWHLDAHAADLRGVRIGGGLFWQGARLRATSGRALNANAAEIGASVLLSRRFRAATEVNFVRARIGGHLDCTGGWFEAATGRALDADSAEIGASVFLRDGFFASGTIDFVRARIAGNLILSGGLLEPANGQVALDLHSAEIGASLMFAIPRSGENAPVRIAGDVDLSNARCAVLDDAPLQPAEGQPWLKKDAELILDGFTYGRLGSRSPTDWPNRKTWLDCQPEADRRGADFKPQPFEQLARVLREMGHNSEARSAGLIKQHRMHMRPGLPLSSRLFRRLLMWPSGYGYRPQFPALAGVVVMAFALFVTGTAYRLGYMTPAQPHGALAAISAELGATPPDVDPCLLADATETVPPFNAAAYVIDAFVPLVDIDQESSWKPAREARCEGQYTALAPLDEINPGWFSVSYERSGWDGFVAGLAQGGWLHTLQWLLMISGFAISALIAASLSGLIRRD